MRRALNFSIADDLEGDDEAHELERKVEGIGAGFEIFVEVIKSPVKLEEAGLAEEAGLGGEPGFLPGRHFEISRLPGLDEETDLANQHGENQLGWLAGGFETLEKLETFGGTAGTEAIQEGKDDGGRFVFLGLGLGKRCQRRRTESFVFKQEKIAVLIATDEFQEIVFVFGFGERKKTLDDNERSFTKESGGLENLGGDGEIEVFGSQAF